MRLLMVAGVLAVMAGCSTGPNQQAKQAQFEVQRAFTAQYFADPLLRESVVLVHGMQAFPGDGTFNPWSVPMALSFWGGREDSIRLIYNASVAEGKDYLPGLKRYCAQKGRKMKVIGGPSVTPAAIGNSLGSVMITCPIKTPTRNRASGEVKVW